ncbi:LysR family transcriptional regulator [Aestuariicella sp. G3-2]|uniref:LysR family transcriptional regulator n=1 Tax=Pseudomaricurvus albidus TaxID=2842452 RepID=UPI001C0AC952|nr:LysR family transcriptional regulator [Aestuariicella albida]MBU3069372.1 LysR family transcriptional regulator [Aestuariicella albida]
MDSMDLRKLEIFVQVARLKNFSKAAQVLHMAQPPVSIAVRKLEEELGTELLIRDKRTLALTHEGETVLAQAEVILRQVEDLKETVGDYQGLLRGELNLACPAMAGTYLLPQLLGEFLDLHSGLTAAVTQAGTHKIEQLLLNDEIELGVVTSLEDHKNLDVVPLVTETMMLCVGSESPFRDRRSVAVSELAAVPMILYERDYFIRKSFDVMCEDRGVEPDIRLQTNYLPLISKLVKQNHGATVGLKMMAQQEPGIHAVPLEPAISVNLGIARRKGRTISRANQAFIDWLVSVNDPVV